MTTRSTSSLVVLILTGSLLLHPEAHGQKGPGPMSDPGAPTTGPGSKQLPGMPSTGMLKGLKPSSTKPLPSTVPQPRAATTTAQPKGAPNMPPHVQVINPGGVLGARPQLGAAVGGGPGQAGGAGAGAGQAGAAGALQNPAGGGAGAAGAAGGGANAGAGKVLLREGKDGEIKVEKDARCIPWKEGELREFNYPDKEIIDIVQEIAQNFCQNFIIPPASKRGGKITILSFKKVDRDEAWRAFLAALNANKMTIVPAGAYLKLLQQADAKGSALPLLGPTGHVPDDDRLIIRIIPLQYVDAQDAANVLLKLKSQAGDVVPYPRTNSLIVTEVGTVIRQFLDIIKYIDVPGGTDRIWVYQVQYGTAQELAQVLEQIFETKAGGGGKAGGAAARKRPGAAAAPAQGSSGGGGEEAAEFEISKIIADERTNQLILLATERAFSKVMEVLRHLDVNVADEGQIHVYYLKNADAEEISGVISGVASGQGQAAKGAKGHAAKGGVAGAAGGAVLFEGEVKVTADKATNSLVVIASNQDYASLIKVIEMLDIRRPQVFVEAIIMEMNISKTRELGLAMHGGYLYNYGGEELPLVAGTNMKGGSLNSITVNPLSLMGLGAMFTGPKIEGSGELLGLGSDNDLPGLGMVLNALQTDDDVNILSTPHILTTDNEEATIEIGQNVPFLMGGSGGGGLGSALGGLGSLSKTGAASSALSSLGSLGGLSSLLGGYGGYGMYNIQRQDVSLKLKINPHINESDFVRLEVEQTIEELGADNPGLGPTTTKRAAKTTIVAKDQQTVVIGGLMRDNTIDGVEKVPFLGDIPILGYLFRTEKRTVQKQNLMLMLTPYIIRDPSDFRSIFNRKMKEREEFLDKYARLLKTDVKIPIDYERKHGLLEEIHQTVRKSRAEKALRDQSLQQMKQTAPLFEEVGGAKPSENPKTTPSASPNPGTPGGTDSAPEHQEIPSESTDSPADDDLPDPAGGGGGDTSGVDTTNLGTEGLTTEGTDAR